MEDTRVTLVLHTLVLQKMKLLTPSVEESQLRESLSRWIREHADTESRRDEYYLWTLSTVAELVDSLKGYEPSDPRITQCQGLLLQIIQMASSAHQLAQGTDLRLPSGDRLQVVDVASIAVITRACLETFVCFHYVFVDCMNDSDAFDIRFSLWDLSGKTQFANDQLVDNEEPSAEYAAKKDENKRVEVLRTVLGQKLCAQRLKSKHIKKILRYGDWTLGKGRQKVTEECDLGPLLSSRGYAYLSSFVHADSHAANQLRTASANPDDQKKLTEVGLITIHTLLSKTVFSLVKLVPSVIDKVSIKPQIAASIAFHSSWTSPLQS